MSTIHATLQEGNRWNNLSLSEQMANIGADVGRAIKWKEKNNLELANKAAYRALELLSFSIDDPKNLVSVKEPTRTQEVLTDFLLGSNDYNTQKNQLIKYFLVFNYSARSNT